METHKPMIRMTTMLMAGVLLFGWEVSGAQLDADGIEPPAVSRQDQTELSPTRHGSAYVGESGAAQRGETAEGTRKELDGPPYRSDEAIEQPIRPGQMDQEETVPEEAGQQ